MKVLRYLNMGGLKKGLTFLKTLRRVDDITPFLETK